MKRLAALLLLAPSACVGPAALPGIPDGVATVQSEGRTLVVGCPRCRDRGAEIQALARRDAQLAATAQRAIDELGHRVSALEEARELKPEEGSD